MNGTFTRTQMLNKAEFLLQFIKEQNYQGFLNSTSSQKKEAPQYYNDEDLQERIAAWRDCPIENKGVGVRIEDPEPDFASLSRSLGVAGFGPVTGPTKLGDVLDEAITIVRSGKSAVIDIRTQAR